MVRIWESWGVLEFIPTKNMWFWRRFMALALPHYIYKYLYLGPQFTKTKHTASTSGWQQNRVFFMDTLMVSAWSRRNNQVLLQCIKYVPFPLSTFISLHHHFRLLWHHFIWGCALPLNDPLKPPKILSCCNAWRILPLPSLLPYLRVFPYMEVPPKSSILIVLSLLNPPHFGATPMTM